MKKLIVFFFALLAIIVSNAQSVTVENNYIKFPSLNIYEQYSENTLNQNDIINFAASSLNVTTLYEDNNFVAVDTLYPDFLKQILNTDKIYKMSDFFVKIDLENHQALVINSNISGAYQTLVNNNTNASGVMVFNDDTDNAMEILEGIENGTFTAQNYQASVSPSPNGVLRRCGGAARQTHKIITIWNTARDGVSACEDGITAYAADCKIVYQKLIFFFSIQTKITSLRGCTYSNWILVPTHNADLYLNSTVKYIKVNSCGREWNQSKQDQTFGTVLNWRGYVGARALNKYIADADFTIKHSAAPGPLVFALPHLHIQSGY